MRKILFIDATVRKGSRTRRLAEALLNAVAKEDDKITRIKLSDMDLSPITEDVIDFRDKALLNNDFSDSYFDPAKQFIDAEMIIIAAPYYDFSFPASLKLYIETVSVNGITFTYGSDGMPAGSSKAEMLYYVTTAGGEIGPYNLGYDYVKTVTRGLFGVKDTQCLRAVGLDIIGADPEEVLKNAISGLEYLKAEQ